MKEIIRTMAMMRIVIMVVAGVEKETGWYVDDRGQMFEVGMVHGIPIMKPVVEMKPVYWMVDGVNYGEGYYIDDDGNLFKMKTDEKGRAILIARKATVEKRSNGQIRSVKTALCQKGRKTETVRVHSLQYMANCTEAEREAYFRNRHEYHIHHIDGDPTNNRFENLQMLTQNEHGQISRPRKMLATDEQLLEWFFNGETASHMVKVHDEVKGINAKSVMNMITRALKRRAKAMASKIDASGEMFTEIAENVANEFSFFIIGLDAKEKEAVLEYLERCGVEFYEANYSDADNATDVITRYVYDAMVDIVTDINRLEGAGKKVNVVKYLNENTDEIPWVESYQSGRKLMR